MRSYGRVDPKHPSMAYEFLRRHLCVVMYKAPGLTPLEEWEAYLDFVESFAHYGSQLKFFVHNHDGQMPREAQSRLAQIMRGAHPRVAMFSTGSQMRFVIAVISAWNRAIRLFAPDELEAAFDHLQCDGEQRQAIEAAFERVRARVGVQR